MFVLTSWLERSSISRPSPSHTREPSALSTVMGLNGPCACHEWNTCLRSSSCAIRPRSIRASVMGWEAAADGRPAAASAVVSSAAAAAVLSVMVIVDS